MSCKDMFLFLSLYGVKLFLSVTYLHWKQIGTKQNNQLFEHKNIDAEKKSKGFFSIQIFLCKLLSIILTVARLIIKNNKLKECMKITFKDDNDVGLNYYTPASRWQSLKRQIASQTGTGNSSPPNAQARHVFSAQEQTRWIGECWKKT